jgi:hypothetical protein
MPAWPKSFYTFGLSLKTAATEWKLRHKRSAVGCQERTFAEFTPRLASTSFWRAAGIERGMTYPRFQARVPLHTYDQLTPAIGRMKRGEADVLWPGRCALFALSSGTVNGEAKLLPVTEEMLAHLRRGGRDALLYYTVRAKHAGVFRGRHLLLGGPTALLPVPDAAPNQAYAGELGGIAAVNLPAWAEKHLYEPGPAAGNLADCDARLDAIVARTRGRDISLIAGIPSWVVEFACLVRQRCSTNSRRIDTLQQLWPNLECFVHTGIPVGPFAEKLRQLLGKEVKFHEVYTSAEGFVAAQDTAQPGAGLRLMADLGVFFEFLPMSEYSEAWLPELGPKAIPLSAVKTGVDYGVIITTPGGLVRYPLGDVVRFVSLQPPRIVYVGRTVLQLNAFGERVMEKEVTDALTAVCTRHHWSVVNFHVAPLFPNAFAGSPRGRHEWWVELEAGTVETPTGPQIGASLEVELQRMNPEYAARRKSGAIDSPIVRLVMPGVFEHWLRYQERWGGQHKMGRCRSDRAIADELAQITNFARD